MQALLRHLDWQAIFVGFVGGYAVPIVVACVISPGTWLIWFWILSPIVAGYLAAKMAGKLPLLHGLAVSVAGLLVFGLLISSRQFAWPLWILVNIACSLFGATIWRRFGGTINRGRRAP